MTTTSVDDAVNVVHAFIQANADAPGAQVAADAVAVISADVARRRAVIQDEAAALGSAIR